MDPDEEGSTWSEKRSGRVDVRLTRVGWALPAALQGAGALAQHLAEPHASTLLPIRPLHVGVGDEACT